MPTYRLHLGEWFVLHAEVKDATFTFFKGFLASERMDVGYFPEQ